MKNNLVINDFNLMPAESGLGGGGILALILLQVCSSDFSYTPNS